MARPSGACTKTWASLRATWSGSSSNPRPTTCTSAPPPRWPTRCWRPGCAPSWPRARAPACRTTSPNAECAARTAQTAQGTRARPAPAPSTGASPPALHRRTLGAPHDPHNPRKGRARAAHAPHGQGPGRRPCDNRRMPFAPLANDSFLRACRRQATDYTPLWPMRPAGRHLPEYQASRARAGSFMGLATSVDYATEVTLQPLERFPLDAAILFSDILTVPDAMGLGLSFAEGEGPRLAKVVRDEAAVAA